MERLLTDRHQRVLGALFVELFSYASARGGRVRSRGTPILVAPGLVRLPDIAYLGGARDHLRREDHWAGADLVVEVLGPEPAERTEDLVTKRSEYAAAAIGEYWIVDPENAFITVLRLGNASAYVDAGLYERGHVARSATLQGFEVDVRKVVDSP